MQPSIHEYCCIPSVAAPAEPSEEEIEPWTPGTCKDAGGEWSEDKNKCCTPPADIDLQVPLPGLERANLPTYLEHVFKYSINIAGIIVTVVIMYGGILYLTAGGNPGAIQNAKSYISSAIFGLILVFGSYTLFQTINPKLLDFQMPVCIEMIKKIEFELSELELHGGDTDGPLSPEVKFNSSSLVKVLQRKGYTSEEIRKRLEASGLGITPEQISGKDSYVNFFNPFKKMKNNMRNLISSSFINPFYSALASIYTIPSAKTARAASASPLTNTEKREAVVEEARKFHHNVMYALGGKGKPYTAPYEGAYEAKDVCGVGPSRDNCCKTTQATYDCSGFVAAIYQRALGNDRLAGKCTADIFDSSLYLNNLWQEIEKVEDLVPGDLVGWGKAGKIGHVLMVYEGKGRNARLIHSHGPTCRQVKNKKTGKYIKIVQLPEKPKNKQCYGSPGNVSITTIPCVEKLITPGYTLEFRRIIPYP